MTYLHPIATATVLLSCILILTLPRRYVMIPFLFSAIFIPLGQRVVIVGLDFYMVRIMVLAGWLRAFNDGSFRRLRMVQMDKLMIALVIAWTITYTLHRGVHDSTLGALVFRIGVSMTCLGSYSMARLFVDNREDLKRIIVALVAIAALVAVAMTIEKHTGRNAFSVFGGVAPITPVRDGRIRCTGPFTNYILAGTFGASLVPLVWGLWWQGQKYKRQVWIGLIAATTVTVTCASSGPILAYAAGVGALCFWLVRGRMQTIRWTVAALLVGLHFAMEAPVWALINRVNVLSASTGYHRFMLIDSFIRHFGQWWFIGVPEPRMSDWGFFGRLTDVTNQFVRIGVDGGLLSLALFIAIIAYAFANIGKMMKVFQGTAEQKLMWGVGASIFAHVASFMSVSYFDQIVVVWYFLLGTVAALWAATLAAQPGAMSTVRVDGSMQTATA